MSQPTPEQIAKLPKWALQHVVSLKDELALSRAFAWPTSPEPSPIPREEIRSLTDCANPKRVKLVTGWFFHTYNDSFQVSIGCSDGVNHDDRNTEKTSTQGIGRMFRSRADAFCAARWEMCRRFAEALAKLDKENMR